MEVNAETGVVPAVNGDDLKEGLGAVPVG